MFDDALETGNSKEDEDDSGIIGDGGRYGETVHVGSQLSFTSATGSGALSRRLGRFGPGNFLKLPSGQLVAE